MFVAAQQLSGTRRSISFFCMVHLCAVRISHLLMFQNLLAFQYLLVFLNLLVFPNPENISRRQYVAGSAVPYRPLAIRISLRNSKVSAVHKGQQIYVTRHCAASSLLSYITKHCRIDILLDLLDKWSTYVPPVVHCRTAQCPNLLACRDPWYSLHILAKR